MNHVEALSLVSIERKRQETLKVEGRFTHTCADSGISDFNRFTILAEEVGEVARVINERAISELRGVLNPDNVGHLAFKNTEAYKTQLLEEIVQCAALCAAWLERFDFPKQG